MLIGLGVDQVLQILQDKGLCWFYKRLKILVTYFNNLWDPIEHKIYDNSDSLHKNNNILIELNIYLMPCRKRNGFEKRKPF